MLSFLNPALLWALPMALAPVVIHLILLRRARRLPFSDLTLLRAVVLKALPSTRLRQWLLMLLRCLILFFLILAFARPVLHLGAAAGAESSLELVLLLDTSWSMRAKVRGKPRFDWASSAGAALIAALRPSDKVAVAGFSDRLEGELRWMDGPSALDSLRRLRVGERTTDATKALAAAYAFLAHEKSRDKRRAIVLLSDNAAHAFRFLPNEGMTGTSGYDPRVTVLGLAWPESVDNAAISEAYLSPDGPKDGVKLDIKVIAYGGSRGNVLTDLWLKNRRLNQKVLRLEAQMASSEFALPISPEEELWGRLEIRRDALAEDDVYHFAAQVQTPPRVLILYGNSRALQAGGGVYLLKKLLGEGHLKPYPVDLSDGGRLKDIRLEDYKAILLDDFRELPAGMPEALQRYVLRGGGLWIIAGTQAQAGTYRSLASLLPAQLGAVEELGSLSGLLPEEIPLSPQKSRFQWDEFEIKEVAIRRRYGLELNPKTQVLFRDGWKRPILVAGKFGHGQVFLWASALDIGWTNLGLKPIFPAIVDVGLRHLTDYRGSQVWRTFQVGNPIARTFEAREPAPAQVVVRAPDGRRTTLWVRDRKVEFTDTGFPGIYFMEFVAGTKTHTEAYAFNLDRTGPEGDLQPVKKFPGRMLQQESLREDFFREIYGRESRSLLLGVVLAFWILETFWSSLITPSRAKSPKTDAQPQAGLAEPVA